VVLNVATQEVLTVCGSEGRGLFGQAKQTFTFALPPNASVGVVRGMVAKKLSAASACVHLQVLMRESRGCEPVTCGSVADELDGSRSRDGHAGICVRDGGQSQPLLFVLCCVLCCCAGYRFGKTGKRDRQRQRL
jgi:hypothetical protein